MTSTLHSYHSDSFFQMSENLQSMPGLHNIIQHFFGPHTKLVLARYLSVSLNAPIDPIQHFKPWTRSMGKSSKIT